MAEFRILDYEELDKELKQYQVELVEPSSYSTQKTNKKMVRIQSYKDRVQSIIEDASKNRNVLEQKVNELTMQIERKREGLMINNQDIKDLAQKKAEAAINLKLKEDLEKLNLAENMLLDAKDFEARARLRYNNLDSTNKNISRLMSMFGVMFMRGEIQMSQEAKNTSIKFED